MKRLRIAFVGVCVFGLIAGVASQAMAQAPRRSNRVRTQRAMRDFQPSRRMVDAPTAGTLRKGTFDTELRAYPDGGVLAILQIGLTTRWTVGLGYGGTDIISATDPEWNPRMNFITKLRLVEETMMMPAIAVGFEEQGFGRWIDSLDRYETKAKGFFVVASKGYRSGSVITSLHGGMNLAPESNDKDNDISFFMGADMQFENNFGIVFDYDLGLNDDKRPLGLGEGNGYLNAGIRWMMMNRIFMEANVKDLLSNRVDQNSVGRELRIIYVEAF
jgi:hypothetical protein